MRLVHAIHDFLPRHRAGSEIYAFELARELGRRHEVFVVAAEYDPAAAHGTIRWRTCDGLPVVEIVNNWEFARFEETYSSPRINAQLQHALEATCPDVVHVHSLLNLSFDLPRLARERGAAAVATLHDHTLVCASGGQRVHVAETHVCHEIDPVRCARCFPESPLGRQLAAGRVTRLGARPAAAAAAAARRLAPRWAAAAAARLQGPALDAGDITRRLASARHVFDSVDLFVAPSAALRNAFVALGMPEDRIEVSDYGFAPASPAPRPPRDGPLRIGFVGTLVWHKGVHVLIEALGRLKGGFSAHLFGDVATFPDYVADLRRMASGLPVTFEGGFDRDSLDRIYGGIDVLVIPSLWPENSPLVIHEAFMHGVPVVAARTGGIPELVADGVNGLLYEPFSAAALGDSLQRLIEDPAAARRLGAAAPAVKDIAADAAEWEARYGRVLAARGRAEAG